MVPGYRWRYFAAVIQTVPVCSSHTPGPGIFDSECQENDSCHHYAGSPMALFDTNAQPARRFTSTIPAATSPGVTGSPSHSAPNSSANTGVRNTNTEILVAG